MAKTEKTETSNFVNPFKPGVSMDSFIQALGDKSVKEYLSNDFKTEVDGEPVEFNDDDVKWLEKEIKNHAYNVANKERLLAESAQEWKELNKK